MVVLAKRSGCAARAVLSAEAKLESALEDVRALRTLIDEGDSDGEH